MAGKPLFLCMPVRVFQEKMRFEVDGRYKSTVFSSVDESYLIGWRPA